MSSKWKVPINLRLAIGMVALCAATLSAAPPDARKTYFSEALSRLGSQKGVCAVLGVPKPEGPAAVTRLAKRTGLLLYVQSPNADDVDRMRRAAEAAGLLGERVFVEHGDSKSVHLASNLADWILVTPEAQSAVSEDELLRVLHPGGTAILKGRDLVKPAAVGADTWSHPYHAPDNNPQSTDQLARAPYLTQFLADPKFVPMPEVSVAAGGRVFRAFGHIAHKANQNAMLNTLICANAYNGTILWTRPLPKGFMIHRNTWVATPDILYMGDQQSCKLIDAATGQVKDEIVVPDGISDGPVWKWMGLVDGVLYALVGGKEIEVATKPSQTPGLGHWPWGMWQGHDYSDPKTSFGFGRTFLAIDLNTKKVLWSHGEEDYVDSRGVCMRGGRIYFYSPEKFLGCLDAQDGQVLWKNTHADLLEAIGPNGSAQHYVTGYATSAYIKCVDAYILFAGPQRSRLVAARAADGQLLWQKDQGNFQLVLREDGIYAAGQQQRTPTIQNTGYKLAYETGEVLAPLPMRRACTRATGSVDSVFYRASGGTMRIDTVTNSANHIAPMRPPCQDGVIISDGNLYWGPWMCGCQLSFYGHICLTSGRGFDYRPGLDDARWETKADNAASVKPLDVRPGDWPTYQGDNARHSSTQSTIPKQVTRVWSFQVTSDGFPTAPVAAGDLVFFGDRNGIVRALRAADGKLQWQAYTGGAIYFPPAIEDGRLFVGSADGRVYSFEAATGRSLWTFRAAPAHRWIPVYGKLMSTWPVSGGVVAQDGVVYAAAGMAHYDGTHVYALDAASGQVKWYNDSSGTTSKKANHGVSLQGNLYIRDGELRFVGGGVHEIARYDLVSGKCLNEPTDAPKSKFPTAFYALYPHYGKYLSLDYTLPDGSTLSYDASYEGSRFANLTRLKALPAGVAKPVKPVSRWIQRRGPASKQKAFWQEKSGRRFTSFLVGPHRLVTAGHRVNDANASFVAAVDLEDGTDVWNVKLPALAVKGGLAIDHASRIVVSLENGQVLCLGRTPD